MEKTNVPLNVSSDVLHIPAASKLSAEEVAKALAHHKRHHHDGQPAPNKGAQKPGGKKHK